MLILATSKSNAFFIFLWYFALMAFLIRILHNAWITQKAKIAIAVHDMINFA